MPAFSPGEHVLTPLGKGVVLEVRNRRVLVRVQSRDVLLSTDDIKSTVAASSPRPPAARQNPTHKRTGRAATFSEGISAPGKDLAHSAGLVRVIDVHGKTVEQALEGAEFYLRPILRTMSLVAFHAGSGVRGLK